MVTQVASDGPVTATPTRAPGGLAASMHAVTAFTGQQEHTGLANFSRQGTGSTCVMSVVTPQLCYCSGKVAVDNT